MTVARMLVDELFLHFAVSEQLHTDQRHQELLAEVNKLLITHKNHTMHYHPQCDGLVEHWNRMGNMPLN